MFTKFTDTAGKTIWVESTKVLTIHDDAGNRTLVFSAGGDTFFELADHAESVKDKLEKANRTHRDLLFWVDLSGKILSGMLANGTSGASHELQIAKALNCAEAVLKRVYKVNDSETAANEVQACVHREKSAVAKCDTCGRYTDDWELFTLCDMKCQCGANNWIYDFAPPDHMSKWSKQWKKPCERGS